jgi:hypothetical protein
MPDLRKLGWYSDQGSVRLGLDPGGIRASLGGRVENVIVHYRSGEIVISSAEDERHQP